ncbi:MAG: thioredoxin family protein [Sphingobacteriales bacterium]|nr:MAG: thioredoxin family protein [Sphingobacteriales bacterium]
MIFNKAQRHFSYPEFLAYAAQEVALNESNPERITDPKYAHYTKLNLQRMKRWDKTFMPDAQIAGALKTAVPQEWWVITEAWCGDSAQNLPVIAALAEAAGTTLRIVLRDENPEIIVQYLTNGTKSIPILVSFDEDKQQLFRWGPRPAAAQRLMEDWKTHPAGRDFEAFELEMHRWYTNNKGKDTQVELSELI